MNLHKLIFTQNDCYKAGKTITPKGIMVHSTGANNPNLKRYVGPDDGLLGVNVNKNYWNQARPEGGQQICVHGFIGKLNDCSVATYQALPWNQRGWHCGKYSVRYRDSFGLGERGVGLGEVGGHHRWHKSHRRRCPRAGRGDAVQVQKLELISEENK